MKTKRELMKKAEKVKFETMTHTDKSIKINQQKS